MCAICTESSDKSDDGSGIVPDQSLIDLYECWNSAFAPIVSDRNNILLLANICRAQTTAGYSVTVLSTAGEHRDNVEVSPQ